MSDGRKLILSLFTGRKKRKAWNKTREKYMPVKRRQSETDRGSYYEGIISDITIKTIVRSIFRR